MEYKTKGVCSMAIQYDIDDYWWMFWKYTGSCQTCRRYAGERSNCTPGGNPVWTQTYFMP